MKQSYLIMLLFFSISAMAQDFDFGKVSKEELEEKFNPLDSSASAAYLYKYRKTFFEYQPEEGFQLITEIQERIKIYNKEGFKYANKIIGLHKNGNDDERVSSLKAHTYNLLNGKIEGTKLDKNGIFDIEQSKYLNETKFTMPDIKEGSVVEYKYKIYSPFFWNIEDFEFQQDIPIKKLEAKIETPEYFNFKLNTKGFRNIVPIYDTKRGKLFFKNKVPINENQVLDASTQYRTGEVDFNINITTYNLIDIQALKDESHVNNIDNYRSSVNYELSYTHFPYSTIEYYSTTWEDVVKAIYKSSNFGDELDKTGYFENDIDALISNVSDPKTRTDLIFDFVKSKLTWNRYYGKYCEDGVRKAYKDQVGNVAEINLMLTAMLRYAGLNAYPVLVSTRQNGVPLFPTREGYNYVVTYVRLPEGVILLDATNKYSTPNVLPFRALNWQGRVIAEHGGSELIDLYPREVSKNSLTFMVSLDENGSINGGYRAIKTNHNALLYREVYNDVNKVDFLEKLENKYNGLEISDFEVKNDYDLTQPIVESYKFVKESQADIIGDKLYFSPMFFLKTSENPFKLEKREFPVDFGYPSSSTYRILINLPEGYKIESLPKPEAFMMPDNLGVFKYNITGNEKSIQLNIETEIDQSIISPVYYDSLKAYFKQLVEKESEQIVLKKVSMNIQNAPNN